MKSEKLYDGITGIRDELIEEAQNTKLKRSAMGWRRRGTIAAVFLLIACIGVAGMWQLLGNMGANSGAGGAGHSDGSTEFMSYAGPVFPLTLLDDSSDINTDRSLTYDFSISAEKRSILVTDSYSIENETDYDKTVTAIYPFAGSFNTLNKPTITVDGSELETNFHSGPYSGSFTGVLGSGGAKEEGFNLDHLNSWEEYAALLSSGSYMKQAFSKYPELNQSVVVYEFTNPHEPDVKDANPTLAMEFNMDYDATTVFTYGFNGGMYDRENGIRRCSFFVPNAGTRWVDSTRVVIVMGRDIENYTLKGYRDGGCDKALDGVSATVTRSETTFGEILLRLAKEHIKEYFSHTSEGVPFDMYYGAACQLLVQYGALGNKPMERYDSCMLEDVLSDTISHNRVMYLTSKITIPAGKSVTVAAEFVKNASFDFYCAHSKNKGLYGYDMVTKLGSNLPFRSLTASITNYGNMEIVRQNYGFDLSNGIARVSLDPEIQHYYMEVRYHNTK